VAAGGRVRLAAVLAAVGVVLGGTAAAYAGALPAPVQELAHHVLGAPAARHSSDGHPRTPPSHAARTGRQPGERGRGPLENAAPHGIAKNAHSAHPGKPVRQRQGGHGRNPKKSSRLNR
jgi:hypothetical protein